MSLVTRGYGHLASIAAVVGHGFLPVVVITTTISPSADAAGGGWTPVGAATLAAAIGETLPNDTNYIQSSVGPAFDVCRIQFAASTAPSGTIILSYRVSQDSTSQDLTLTTTLKQGTTPIAFWSNEINSGQFTTFNQKLTPAQVAAITDWTNLFLEFDANPFNPDTLALLLTSQLGPNADATHTVYTQPWFRVSLNGSRVAGDTMQLIINGVDNSATVLSATDITNGYVDVQIAAPLAAGTYSAQCCIIRSGARSAVTSAATITIFPYAFDGIPNLYAAHGLQRMLTSYAGPLAQILRTDLSTTLDLLPQPDGYVHQSLTRMFTRNNGSPSIPVTKVYDQTGNSRDATPVNNARRPFITNNQDAFFGGTLPDWGFRSLLVIEGSAGFTLTTSMTVANMGAYAQSVSGLTLAISAGRNGSNTPAGTDTPMMTVSVNGGTGRRAAIFSTTPDSPYNVRAGGRRTDADTEADTAAIPVIPPANFGTEWTNYIARFDYANAVLKFNAYETSTTLNPFETPGTTDNTTSDSVIIGADAGAQVWNGTVMGMGWFQRALTDVETSNILNNQFNYKNVPRRPLVSTGVRLAMETFRQALISKLFVGPPYNGVFPTGGFDTSNLNTTDPLIAVGHHPSNLLQFDHHTIKIFNDSGVLVGTTDVGVWIPTVVSSNGKLIIYQCGTEGYPPTNSFNDATWIQTMVQAGYTFAECGWNGITTEPTSTYTPYRTYCEPAIKTCNALIGGFAKPPMLFGFSGGAPGACVIGAIDPRFAVTISHDQNMPAYANTDGGYWHQAPGVIDLNAQTNCDFPDLWLLCLTGSTTRRICYLSFSDTQTPNQGFNWDWFTPSLQVGQLYQAQGQFGTFFDGFITGHQVGSGAISLALNLYGRY